MDRYPDADWLQTRFEAETVECPYCGAKPRETCRHPKGWELERLPAHHQRISAAKEQGDA